MRGPSRLRGSEKVLRDAGGAGRFVVRMMKAGPGGLDVSPCIRPKARFGDWSAGNHELRDGGYGRSQP